MLDPASPERRSDSSGNSPCPPPGRPARVLGAKPRKSPSPADLQMQIDEGAVRRVAGRDGVHSSAHHADAAAGRLPGLLGDALRFFSPFDSRLAVAVHGADSRAARAGAAASGDIRLDAVQYGVLR